MSEEKKGAPKVYPILNVQLETFERAALLRRPQEAGPLLLQLIERLRTGADFIGFTTDDPIKQKLYSRLSSAIVAMLADPMFQFSTQGWAMFAANHPVMQAIFECSIFDTSENLVPALISNPEERDARKYKFDDSRSLAKFLLTYCLNGQTELNFDELFNKAAATTLPLWLGMLAHHVCLHPNSHERREALVDTGHYFDKLALPDGLLAATSDAYMYCSYLTRRDKHKLKDTFGRMLRNMIEKIIAAPTEKEITTRRLAWKDHKPTILIPLEWFNSFHAMYRCYAPAISQLRPYFRLVAAIKEKDIDAKARESFDDFLWIPDDNVELDKLVVRITELSPDMIFYPSIGMALWWVALSQIRLAPIQIMGLGHPASSHSPVIDYVLADRGMINDPALFTERVLEVPENSFRFSSRTDATIPEPYVRAVEDDVIRIAVPSMVVKITVPFLQMCRQIAGRVAPRKLEFHFFPNVLGIWRFQAKRQLERWLPGCVVHHRYEYQPYLNILAKCDLHFSTFPFGGTNSLVDSMMCGVPILAMVGDHVHERCDSWALNRAGLGPLVSTSTQDYEDLAVDLIKDDERRESWRQHLRSTDIDGIFHGPLAGEADGAVLRAFQHVYRHHEEIQATDERVIPWEKQA